MTIILPYVKEVPMEEILANSFRDYHVKGFDYICLRRSPKETVKLYFFDGDVSKMPEVVNPHDHRYAFNTLCVAGEVQNTWFEPCAEEQGGEVFQRFSYETPLLGGKGFAWQAEERLRVRHRSATFAGRRYWMNHDEIHTIRLMQQQTVICLVQYEDQVTDAPTTTFCRDREPPSLEGLYNRFDADAVRARLLRLEERAPGIHLPTII